MFVGGAGAAVDVDDAPGAVDAIEETQKKNSVYCRIRPFIPRTETGAECSIESLTSTTIKIKEDEKRHFDHVFAMDSSQISVYEHAAAGIIKGFIDGYDGCIMAYGQTSSGKTFTMGTAPGVEGIIQISMQDIFRQLNATDGLQVSLKCSFVELYQNEVRDLLRKRTDEDLDPKPEVIMTPYAHLKNCVEIYVINEDEVLEVMLEGLVNRTTSATILNDASSRSHSILVLNLSTRAKESSSSVKQRTLFFVDLAGSERPQGGRLDTTFIEGTAINQSLLNIKAVFRAIAKKTLPTYGDHNITKLLKDAFGGNYSKVCLIIHCSPALSNIDETKSSLSFGTAVFGIKASVVEKPVEETTETLQRRIRLLEEENTRLRNLLPAASGGLRRSK